MFGIYARLYSRELPNILIDQIKVGDVDDHKEDDSDEKKVKVMARHLKSNRSLRQMRPTADILSWNINYFQPFHIYLNTLVIEDTYWSTHCLMVVYVCVYIIFVCILYFFVYFVNDTKNPVC